MVGGREEKVADGEAESADGEQAQADGLGFSPGIRNGNNGVHFASEDGTKPVTEVHEHGKAPAKRADGPPPARPRGGILRGASGGILRGISGGVHLPRLESIMFEMTRLPEEDAGVQRRFTETKEVETPPETPRAGPASDADAAAPARTKSKLRKHLTAVGACSFGLRLSETVLSLIAIVVMCSDSHSVAEAEFGTLKFNHFQAYRYITTLSSHSYACCTIFYEKDSCNCWRSC